MPQKHFALMLMDDGIIKRAAQVYEAYNESIRDSVARLNFSILFRSSNVFWILIAPSHSAKLHV